MATTIAHGALMQAAFFLGPNQMELREAPVPVPGLGEVLLRVNACAVCGTDLRILGGGKTRGVYPPRVLGHEIAAHIVSYGEGAEAAVGLPIGQRVVFPPGITCGACRFCVIGMENHCKRREAFGYKYDGGFAEYMVVPAHAARRGILMAIPDTLADAEASLAEPLACVVNGQRQSQVGVGDVVVVAGAGPIGLMHVQMSRLAGARAIIVSEPSTARREQAMAMGATMALDPTHDEVLDVVRSVTGGDGADVAIAAIGVPGLVHDLLRWVRPGGRVNLFAGYAGSGDATISANLIHYGELIVTGTSACTSEDFRVALSLLASGRFDASALVSHQFPLAQVQEAFDVTRRGEGLRVVVTP